MLYFTPEAVIRWNSDADEAKKEEYDREWEDAQDAYERHFRLTDLPQSVKSFNELVLHNEFVIALPKATDVEGRVVGYKRSDEYSVVVGTHADESLHVLVYTLEKPPTIRYHAGFDAPETLAVWLYDEFTLDDAGMYCHNILFTNGMELSVTFKSLHWYDAQMREEGVG